MKNQRIAHEGRFEPHPDDREAVSILSGTKCGFNLNPKGQVWQIGLTPFVSDAQIEAVKLFPKLISVVAGSAIRPDENITDDGIIKLASLPNLSALALTNLPRLTDRVAPALASSNIRWLCLNCQTIGDESMEFIGRMNQLLRLSLVGSSVTAESTNHLLKLSNLRNLNLENCDFKPDDLRLLQSTLRKCNLKPSVIA